MRRLLLTLCLALPALADGLPFDKARTHLDAEVVVLKLNPAQRREVARRRRLTLTDAQRARLGVPGTVRELEVLTARYDDCTCGMGNLAVWFRPGEVEVPRSYLGPGGGGEDTDLDEEAGGPDANLIVDEAGGFWVLGRRLDEPAVRAWILDQIRVRREQGMDRPEDRIYLFADLPGDALLRDPEAAKRRLRRLDAFARAHGGRILISSSEDAVF